ncbi:putative baseplate assembly protein [Roseococcus sp. MDT2-1-1]|uniref:Baseplate assembly protein n=1 Tax=Sabulicella glaciei TaxID=2984948 RepID=A0ABT3NQ28_9PROT|nr:putative baseplate assembly protein [Roseococcus sp. MDT2-1-1]
MRASENWNGLDFIEVDEAQTTLMVYFLGRAPRAISADNIRLAGGRGPSDQVKVVGVKVRSSDDPAYDDVLHVFVDKPGDYSPYTLSLVGLEGIDPRYASLEFSFKAGCPSDLDCADDHGCGPEVFPTPPIDYLAKDYAGFRQLMFDRLALTCPDWRERHAPDLGVALVELFAYLGDYLSYYQDAAATEAYLATARRRPSVRRHARLVDYRLSEGCNARALVSVETRRNLSVEAADIAFITRVAGLAETLGVGAVTLKDLGGIAPDRIEWFEPVQRTGRIFFWEANNLLRFHSWGGRECCLHAGATRATLLGQLANRSLRTAEGGPGPPGRRGEAEAANLRTGEPEDDAEKLKVRLAPGDFLIFEERVGPKTGDFFDADPRHRQAVRLTAVRQSRDELLDLPVIEIEWAEADALAFDLCLSTVGPPPACDLIEHVSVARGNVVLVDHGRTQDPEDLGRVPIRRTEQCCECEGEPTMPVAVGGRYRPELGKAPLTFAAPYDPAAPARAVLAPQPHTALPAIRLRSDDRREWTPRYDLLDAGRDDRAFVVEMEEDRRARIRFGDGELGAAPPPGAGFCAAYRVGSGPAGNVGAGAIALLLHRESVLANDIARVTNPIAASGGTAPEPMAEAKLNAPHAFRAAPSGLRRAITPDDYARIAERDGRIQRAAARFAWSGSWYEAAVGLDIRAAEAARREAILGEGLTRLEAVRRIGHELDVRAARLVPIDLALKVCVAPDHLRGHVRAALLEAFSGRRSPDGRVGFFHPDRLAFGGPIYLSAVVAAAQSVPGVVSVQVTRLKRQFAPANREIENGLLPIGLFEVARLDNDPNHPDGGKLELTLEGGR